MDIALQLQRAQELHFYLELTSFFVGSESGPCPALFFVVVVLVVLVSVVVCFFGWVCFCFF